MDKVNFERYALLIILALRGMNQFADWRILPLLDRGHKLLKSYSFWSINFVNRSCNMCAHKLAKWARTSFVRGRVDVTTIPLEVFYDRGGTDILNEIEESSEI